MIRTRERSVIPYLRGLLIMIVVIILFMFVSEATAYMPPPTPHLHDQEGDGDDFYNYRDGLRFRQPAGGSRVPAPDDNGASPAHLIVSSPGDPNSLRREPGRLASIARWVWVVRGIRGF